MRTKLIRVDKNVITKWRSKFPGVQDAEITRIVDKENSKFENIEKKLSEQLDLLGVGKIRKRR